MIPLHACRCGAEVEVFTTVNVEGNVAQPDTFCVWCIKCGLMTEEHVNESRAVAQWERMHAACQVRAPGLCDRADCTMCAAFREAFGADGGPVIPPILRHTLLEKSVTTL
jgi:hypothetical protein